MPVSFRVEISTTTTTTTIFIYYRYIYIYSAIQPRKFRERDSGISSGKEKAKVAYAGKRK